MSIDTRNTVECECGAVLSPHHQRPGRFAEYALGYGPQGYYGNLYDVREWEHMLNVYCCEECGVEYCDYVY